MKYLQTYTKLKIPNDEQAVFDYLIKNLKESIFMWDYFVDFAKVKTNLASIEKELNLLNVLIGKEDIDTEFLDLVKSYPNVRKALPILIAVRLAKSQFKIIDDLDELVSENKTHLFNPKNKLAKEDEQDLLLFFEKSGLKSTFQEKSIKNIVDYCFGVEVGMDTNARKNRTGQLMEKIVEVLIQKFCITNGVEYIAQATQSKIKTKWNFDIQLDKTNRIFDFAVYNKTTNKLFLVETNFYGGGGSKLKSTAGEYQYLNDFLKSQNLDLIWVTDGHGWLTTVKSLNETFLHNDYLFNLEMLKAGVLSEIILK